MGRGNVCVSGPYEGLYFIDNDHIHVYRSSEDSIDDCETRLLGDLDYDELTGGKWLFDWSYTIDEQEDIEECIVTGFMEMFGSFSRPHRDLWLGRESRVLLENSLFYIGIEDNEWSLAVELLQREDPYDNHLEGLQKRHYQTYLDGLKKVLLDRLPSIGTYTGAWTSGLLTREMEEII